jgi:carbamoyl-phosphate synthase small subunit
MEKKKASLILEDGTEFQGFSFGAPVSTSGEVVFNTAMTGYPESLTDPSYCGQILVLTYPMIGNYGVPPESSEDGLLRFFESDKIHVKALVISDYSFEHSHWNATRSLDEWLREQGVPGIYGVDTRQITKIIRERGVMPGRIVVEGSREVADANDTSCVNPVPMVCGNKVETYGNGDVKIVLVDCGCKFNIIRHLTARGAKVIRVPWDYDFTGLDYDGVMLGNGPGDPTSCEVTASHVRKAMEGDKPIFGICLGHQLMALASGAKTYKLKYGHRSHNQPVIEAGTNRSFITPQNHGYAVDTATLAEGWEPWFTNLNDGTNEGIRHREKPFFSVQFHPEAASGPGDTEYLFDKFIDLCRK